MSARLIHNVHDILAKIRAVPPHVMRRVDPELSRGSQLIARDAKLNAPKAHGTLANAIQARKLKDLVHEIVAGTNYARAAEEGSGFGGRPPVQAIEDWMKVKNIEGDAFAIANSVYVKGTPAQPFMQPAYDKNVPEINARIVSVVKSALAGSTA